MIGAGKASGGSPSGARVRGRNAEGLGAASRSTCRGGAPLALAAAAEAPTSLGLKPLILGDALEGEAREVGKVMGGMALSSRSWGLPSGSPAVLLSGGGFQAIGDLGVTGPTLTNINDIRAILIAGARQ